MSSNQPHLVGHPTPALAKQAPVIAQRLEEIEEYENSDELFVRGIFLQMHCLW